MRPWRHLGWMALLMALAYAASPYVALARLHAAFLRGDVEYVAARVAWPSVREGLKQDIAEGVIGPMTETASTATLPPFGASFVAGIAGSVVDREVTPSNMMTVMRQFRVEDPVAPETVNPLSAFDWAFFQGPATFTVSVRPDDGDDGHLRLRLELRKWRWVVTRIWVPQDLVERMAGRT